MYLFEFFIFFTIVIFKKIIFNNTKCLGQLSRISTNSCSQNNSQMTNAQM